MSCLRDFFFKAQCAESKSSILPCVNLRFRQSNLLELEVFCLHVRIEAFHHLSLSKQSRVDGIEFIATASVKKCASQSKAVFGPESCCKPSTDGPKLIAEPVAAAFWITQIHAIDVVCHCNGNAPDSSNVVEKTKSSP